MLPGLCLVLCGRDDPVTPLERSREIAEGIAGSRLVIIESGGHYAPLEQPHVVTDALREWITGIGG